MFESQLFTCTVVMIILLYYCAVMSVVWDKWEGDNECLYSRHSYLLTKQSSSLDALGLPKVFFLLRCVLVTKLPNANGFGEEGLIGVHG